MPAKPSLEKDQAFMVDEKALSWITVQASLRPTDTILEIGAGTGNLTRHLARSGARIIAVEKDAPLASELRKNLRGFQNVEIMIGDGLRVIDSRLKFDKLVSNIPYAISEALIQRLVFRDFSSAVLTLPKPFAHRLIAAPWEKEYSKLSFIFQRFFMVEAVLDLQRDSFSPPPRTNSVAIKFISKPKNSVICQMFLRPNMKAGNALREALCSAKGFTKNRARSAINALGLKNILGKKVAELSVDDIRHLVKSASAIRED
jgi:16S rRNA A1518/A1519 N6-dimethyltransferase RsmA/KsgA/DIM1 with predicted DNA glycosylase/AP lyase activity